MVLDHRFQEFGDRRVSSYTRRICAKGEHSGRRRISTRLVSGAGYQFSSLAGILILESDSKRSEQIHVLQLTVVPLNQIRPGVIPLGSKAVGKRATAARNFQIAMEANHHIVNGVRLVTELDKIHEAGADAAAEIEAGPPFPAGGIGRCVEVPFAAESPVDERSVQVLQGGLDRRAGAVDTRHLGVGPRVIVDVTQVQIDRPGGIHGRIEEQTPSAAANIPPGFHDVVQDAAGHRDRRARINVQLRVDRPVTAKRAAAVCLVMDNPSRHRRSEEGRRRQDFSRAWRRIAPERHGLR